MKNANMPAMPLINGNGAPIHHSNAGMDNDGVMFGMTKREMMAMHMMCAMIGAPVGRVDIDDGEQLPLMAIVAADALLAELERTK